MFEITEAIKEFLSKDSCQHETSVSGRVRHYFFAYIFAMRLHYSYPGKPGQIVLYSCPKKRERKGVGQRTSVVSRSVTHKFEARTLS